MMPMTVPPVRRLLITGSRWWADWTVPHYALAAEWHTYGPYTVLVSGACPPRDDGTPGADRICETLWERWGGQVERYPAKWRVGGRIDKTAGFKRNTLMASLDGVYKCLGFQLNGSEGTQHCMDEARERNIPVSPFEMRRITA
jgi:hypothetical protein